MHSPRHPQHHRFGLSLVGAALAVLFACDAEPTDRSLKGDPDHDDCGCKPDKPQKPHHPHKPGPRPEQPEPGDCGPDGPQPECHEAFHICLEKGGNKDECAPLLDMCEPPPPPPGDDCKQQFEQCLHDGNIGRAHV